MGCNALMSSFSPPPLPPGPSIISFDYPVYSFDQLPYEIREFIHTKNLQPSGRYLLGRGIRMAIEMFEPDFNELQERYRAFKYLEIEHLGRS
jgi:hypothetical protein